MFCRFGVAAGHAPAGRADQSIARVEASSGRVNMLEIAVAIGRDPLRGSLRRRTTSMAGCWSTTERSVASFVFGYSDAKAGEGGSQLLWANRP